MKKQPCDSCAFKAGCSTHDHEFYNRFRAEICGIAGKPFYCHQGFDWRSENLPTPGSLRICQGWLARMKASIEDGQFSDSAARVRLRSAADDATKALAMLVDLPDGHEAKAHLHQIIAGCLAVMHDDNPRGAQVFADVLRGDFYGKKNGTFIRATEIGR